MKLRDILNENNAIKLKIDDLNFEDHANSNGMIQVPMPNSDVINGYRDNPGGVKGLAYWKKILKSKYGVKTIILHKYTGMVEVDNHKFKKSRIDYGRKKYDALQGKDGWGSA